jgi:hypothetical protein
MDKCGLEENSTSLESVAREEPDQVRATADVGGQDFGDNCHNLVYSRAISGGHVVSIGCVGQVLLPEIALEVQVESGILVGGLLGIHQNASAVLERSHKPSPRAVENLLSLAVLQCIEHSKLGS